MAEREVEEMQGALDTLFEISQLLNTRLSKSTIANLMTLVEAGVNPEALATAVKELRQETMPLKQGQEIKNDASFDH